MSARKAKRGIPPIAPVPVVPATITLSDTQKSHLDALGLKVGDVERRRMDLVQQLQSADRELAALKTACHSVMCVILESASVKVPDGDQQVVYELSEDGRTLTLRGDGAGEA